MFRNLRTEVEIPVQTSGYISTSW